MNTQRMLQIFAVSGTMTLMMAQQQPTISTREANQQERIGQGIEQGSLTAGEAARLERGEARIRKEVQTDRAANGGKLTSGERTQVNQQLNGMSQRIYADRHNANTAQYGNNEVDGRRFNQQQRIGQGIENGSLNANQAARLEGRESALNREVREERASNGGHLSSAERRQVDRQLNRTSGQIYRMKHR